MFDDVSATVFYEPNYDGEKGENTANAKTSSEFGLYRHYNSTIQQLKSKTTLHKSFKREAFVLTRNLDINISY